MVHIESKVPTLSYSQRIDIFADYKQDESYTPRKISIRAGTNFHDLQVSSSY